MSAADRADAPGGCIAVAAWFVAAQPGGVRRILEAHRYRPDGSCSCHAYTVIAWPCTAVTIADAAQRYTGDGDRTATGQPTGIRDREGSA